MNVDCRFVPLNGRDPSTSYVGGIPYSVRQSRRLSGIGSSISLSGHDGLLWGKYTRNSMASCPFTGISCVSRLHDHSRRVLGSVYPLRKRLYLSHGRIPSQPGIRSGISEMGIERRGLGTVPLRLGRPAGKNQLLCKAEANAVGNVPNAVPSETSHLGRIVELLTTLFPVWVILGTVVGIYKPSAVTWLETDLFTVGLGFLMLSMGLTLKFEDFRRCLRNPWTVGVGFLAQYFIKPMLGFVIALGLKLSAPLATGLILVSCCPGGQASNVATYISKGNVALSVLMTTCSTIGAIVMTPLLTKVLAGQLVPVDAAGLALSTFQVVLLPTIIGVLSHEYLPKFTEKITAFTPLIGVILTTLLCASPIGQVSDVLKTQGAQLILPVAVLHAAAFALGYWTSKIASFGESTSRTISIECGMQSSALGFLLAQKHFTNPLVAVPSAVSVVFMALGGSALAVFWRNVPIPLDDKDDFKE